MVSSTGMAPGITLFSGPTETNEKKMQFCYNLVMEGCGLRNKWENYFHLLLQKILFAAGPHGSPGSPLCLELHFFLDVLKY